MNESELADLKDVVNKVMEADVSGYTLATSPNAEVDNQGVLTIFFKWDALKLREEE